MEPSRASRQHLCILHHKKCWMMENNWVTVRTKRARSHVGLWYDGGWWGAWSDRADLYRSAYSCAHRLLSGHCWPRLTSQHSAASSHTTLSGPSHLCKWKRPLHITVIKAELLLMQEASEGWKMLALLFEGWMGHFERVLDSFPAKRLLFFFPSCVIESSCHLSLHFRSLLIHFKNGGGGGGSSSVIRSHRKWISHFVQTLFGWDKKIMDTHHFQTEIYDCWKTNRSVIMLGLPSCPPVFDELWLRHFLLQHLKKKIHPQFFIWKANLEQDDLVQDPKLKIKYEVTCPHEPRWTCISSAGMYDHLKLNLALRRLHYCQSSDRPESIWSLITTRV